MAADESQKQERSDRRSKYIWIRLPKHKWPKSWSSMEDPVDRGMIELRISAGAKEKLPTRASGILDAETTSSWSYDMEGHAKKCVARYCELANKTTKQLYRVATPCTVDHQFEEENESV